MKFQTTRFFKVFSVLLAVTTGSMIQAATLVTNLDENMAEQITLTPSWQFTQSFTTGSSGATLQDLTFRGGGGFLIEHVEYLNVKLYEGNGTLRGAFTNPANIAGNLYTFSGNFSLNSNSTYSLGLTVDSGANPYGPGYLNYTSSLNQDGLAGWGIGNNFLTWTVGDTTAPASTTGALSMAMSGVVPEPSSLSLLVLGLSGMAMLRRRRMG